METRNKTSKEVGRSAFTLVELLVVVAIISLLSSIALAAVQEARYQAQAARTSLMVKQYENMLELYALDHDGEYPYQDQDPALSYCLGAAVTATTCVGTNTTDLNALLAPYTEALVVNEQPVTLDDGLGTLTTYTGVEYMGCVPTPEDCTYYRMRWYQKEGVDCQIGTQDDEAGYAQCTYNRMR